MSIAPVVPPMSPLMYVAETKLSYCRCAAATRASAAVTAFFATTDAAWACCNLDSA